MPGRFSRYEGTRPFRAEPATGEAFRGLRPRLIGPAVGVIEHVVRAGDRLDKTKRGATAIAARRPFRVRRAAPVISTCRARAMPRQR